MKQHQCVQIEVNNNHRSQYLEAPLSVNLFLIGRCGSLSISLIVQVHARNKGFKSEREKEELLKDLAATSFDYSGAELQNVL